MIRPTGRRGRPRRYCDACRAGRALGSRHQGLQTRLEERAAALVKAQEEQAQRAAVLASLTPIEELDQEQEGARHAALAHKREFEAWISGPTPQHIYGHSTIAQVLQERYSDPAHWGVWHQHREKEDKQKRLEKAVVAAESKRERCRAEMEVHRAEVEASALEVRRAEMEIQREEARLEHERIVERQRRAQKRVAR